MFLFVFSDGARVVVDPRALSDGQWGEIGQLHPIIFTRESYEIVLERALLSDEQYDQLVQTRRDQR